MKSLFISLSLVLSLLSSPQSQASIIEATFDNGTEGFRLFGGTTTSAPQFSNNGFIFATDLANSFSGFGFLASSAFLGDLSGAFGQEFSFDLSSSGGGALVAPTDSLFSFFNGNQSITFVGSVDPSGIFSTVNAVLEESSNFIFRTDIDATSPFIIRGGDITATNDDIRNVLSNVTDIRISGDLRFGIDTASLDNVRLNLVPEPNSIAVLALGLVLIPLVMRRTNRQE